MKRISFLMITLLLMGGISLAQEPRRGDGKQMDPKVRAERMTEHMTKEYSLNDTQKKQLLEANLTMLEQMKRPEGARQEMRKNKKNKACQATDSCTCKKADQKEGKRVARKGHKKDSTQAPEITKENREKMFQEMKTSRDAYDARIKKILTPEQYSTYTQKQAERQKKGRRKA